MSAAADVDPLAAARANVRRGRRVIPVPYREKAPILTGWQELRLDEGALEAHFNGQPMNIGVLNGQPSGDQADVDLDASEALMLADTFLPPTHAVFGRRSKLRSHRLYICAIETERFLDVDTRGDETAMLVEIRSTGSQTIFPGSTHPSGERVEWAEDGEPASIDAADLHRAVVLLACAAILARHWPGMGARHETALAAAGFLARTGVDEENVVKIVAACARAAGDPEETDRKRAALDTVAAIRSGEAATGGPHLAELLVSDGARVVERMRRWLGERTEHFNLTDTGNAARFVSQHGANFRYCYAWHSWLAWEKGPRWRRDAGDVAMRHAKQTARAIYFEAAQATDETRRKALANWAVYAESERGLWRMLTLAQSELAITPANLDADPWLLNCPNGTLELRTAHLRPHRREDFLTKVTAAPYDPDARLEVWDRFLEGALPDEGARDYAQRYTGYSLTGDTREEVFVFCRGPAGAGKSTFTEGLRRTWGDYAVSADFTSFLAKKPSDGPREDLAWLAGARLVTSVETRDGSRLAAGLVKLLTGGDSVPARRLYERTFEFVPTFKLLLASNYRPRADASDDGLWRRLRELPFPTARPRREDRDDSVKAAIIDPAQAGPAILAWAVEGVGHWLRDGLGEPPAVMQATTAYRRSQEPLADFVADCCVLGAGYSVPVQRLRDEYEAWCKAHGVKYPISGKAWGLALRTLGCTDRRAGGGARWWDGIDLRLGDPSPAREPGEDDSSLFDAGA